MKSYVRLVLILAGILLCYKAMANDEVDSQPINSSFVGDVSNSVVNESWGQEDVPRKTDSEFVGDDGIHDVNSDFSGDNFDKEVHQDTDKAFEGDQPFVGKDYGK
jgi:hypothetical protein